MRACAVAFLAKLRNLQFNFFEPQTVQGKYAFGGQTADGQILAEFAGPDRSA